ncbi:hypothetical protein ACFPPA_04555 [Rhodanobacter ginsengisoli]|uniref:DUF1700 domain-containing protein n=1 Tax=Rhodanobacter ginsengisoli TaxID=418646 RepID=A0ABW0QK41_9GAMM
MTMRKEPRSLQEQFDAMDTRLLLERYRRGGLVPDALSALLSVLEGRGFTSDRLNHTEDAREGRHRIDQAVNAQRFRLKKVGLAFNSLFFPVCWFFLLSAIPVIGNYLMLGFVSLMGCSVNEAQAHPCSLLGWDLADVAYGYVVDAFLEGAANPLLAGWALEKFLISGLGIAWLMVVSILYIAKRRMRRQIERMVASTDG